MKYAIEHFEAFNAWTELEYLNILKHVSSDNLILTSVNPKILPTIHKDLQKVALTTSIENFDKSKILLLDPQSNTLLSPTDSSFEYLLFGGILGDNPPQDRTGVLRRMGFETRSLGPIQMTTDTAVLVSQLIVEGTPIDKIKFIDSPQVRLGKKEEVTLPFRFIEENKRPKIAEGILELIREQGNEPLEF